MLFSGISIHHVSDFKIIENGKRKTDENIRYESVDIVINCENSEGEKIQTTITMFSDGNGKTIKQF
jgi:hypothetical protein